MIYDIRQFCFGESDVTKIRLSAVSNANEFIQETRRTIERRLWNDCSTNEQCNYRPTWYSHNIARWINI